MTQTDWVASAEKNWKHHAQMLSFLIPIAILEYERKGGPTEEDYEKARDTGRRLAHSGDNYQYNDDKGCTEAPTVAQVAKALAIGAWSVGGFDFNGNHYEVKRA